MGSDPVTMVANSVYRHEQSMGLAIHDTAWRPDWNEAVFRHAGSTSVVVFVEKHSLTVLAVHLAKTGLIITCQMLRETVRTNELFTSDNTPYVYRKEMLVVVFDSSMWIITISKWEFLVLLTPSRVKMDLVGEQNVTNHGG